MDRFISLLSVGISLGCVYALVALGFVVIYKATGVINFAQGDMVTLGAYVAFWAVVQQGVPTVAGYVVAVVAMFFAGVVLERVTTAPLRGRSIHVIVIATLGAGLAIRAGIGLWQGSRPQNLPTPLGLRTFDIGGAAIPLQNALIVVVTAVVVTGLMVAFSRTQFGRQVRALAADGEAARLQGILVSRMSMISFGVGGALAGLAAVLFGPVGAVSLTLGFTAMINGFAAAILGGFGRIGGVVVGALLIGVIEQLAAGYVAPEFRELYPFVLMIGVISIYPQGLFGALSSERH